MAKKVCEVITIASGEQIKAIDAYTIETIGIPSMVLMERAALSTVIWLQSHIEPKSKCLVIVEGGNNGGDGIAIARLLQTNGYYVDVYPIQMIKNASDSYKNQMKIWENLDGRCISNISESYDVVLDAMFGVGLHHEVTGIHYNIIKQVNDMNAYKVAIDIPSGIDATTGSCLGIAFQADVTLTYGLRKLGMYFNEGLDACGNVVALDIGFPMQSICKFAGSYYAYDVAELKQLPLRRRNSHKGTYGKVVVIAGSDGMEGAAYFSAAAAYASGAGLVKVVTHQKNQYTLNIQLPECLVTCYQKKEECEKIISEAIEWADAIVIGPGIGQDLVAQQMVYQVITTATCPVIYDADALNILATHQDWIQKKQAIAVFTPHMLEMTRLTGVTMQELKRDRFKVAMDFAKAYDIVCVLKDASTIVPDSSGSAYINISGNNGMATGGSGDVLTGILSGFVAQGLDCRSAAKLATYVHGLSGDEARRLYGSYSMTASDIIIGVRRILGGCESGEIR